MPGLLEKVPNFYGIFINLLRRVLMLAIGTETLNKMSEKPINILEKI